RVSEQEQNETERIVKKNKDLFLTDQKQAIVQDIKNNFQQARAVIFYNFHHAENRKLFKLKKELKKQANAFIFCQGDEYEPLNILNQFAKRHSEGTYGTNNFGKRREEITDLNLDIISIRCSNSSSKNCLEGHLDFSNFVNLEKLSCSNNLLTSIDLSECSKIKSLYCHTNNLTTVDFLNSLPHPEKLEILVIYNNNIQSTNIEVFSKHNKFYGSFKSYQNLIKLNDICIEATDINEGLEYLPESLAKETKERGRKQKLIQDLETKIQQTQQELQATKQDQTDKTKKIERLEQKVQLLEEAKTKLKVELEKEQQQHNKTKTNFQSQLRDLATILFPSNSNISNLSFAALKNETQKIKEKNQELKLALSEEQKVLTEKEAEIN
ncbi:1325_t:CDS:2, partial [Racocetra persica]